MNGNNLSAPSCRAPDTTYPGSPPRSRSSLVRRGGYTIKAKKRKSEKHRAAFKEIQNRTRDALRAAHWDYVNHMLKKGLDERDSKQFWNYLKAQRQDSQGVAP